LFIIYPILNTCIVLFLSRSAKHVKLSVLSPYFILLLRFPRQITQLYLLNFIDLTRDNVYVNCGVSCLCHIVFVMLRSMMCFYACCSTNCPSGTNNTFELCTLNVVPRSHCTALNPNNGQHNLPRYSNHQTKVYSVGGLHYNIHDTHE